MDKIARFDQSERDEIVGVLKELEKEINYIE